MALNFRIPGRDIPIIGQVSETAQQPYQTAEDVIQVIYAGTFKGSCLLPVLPAYQEVLGQACWICANEQQAARKRKTETELVFSVREFKAVIDTAAQGMAGLVAVINAKRTFRGVVGIA